MSILRCTLVLLFAVAVTQFGGCDSPAENGEPTEAGGEKGPTAPEEAADTAKEALPKTDEKPPAEVKPAEEAKVPEEAKSVEEAKPAGPHPALLNPSLANETAPDTFKAKFETTKGDFVIEVQRDWSPNGADRFYNLVKIGFYDGVRFFRVVKQPRLFMAQFGISGDPKVSAKWTRANIEDDPVVQSNVRGFVTYAKTRAPNSRSTQLFINYADNSPLDSDGFAPFGRVVEGMEVVDSLEGKYGEKTTRMQGNIMMEGNAYLDRAFPGLDEIKRATIVE